MVEIDHIGIEEVLGIVSKSRLQNLGSFEALQHEGSLGLPFLEVKELCE